MMNANKPRKPGNKNVSSSGDYFESSHNRLSIHKTDEIPKFCYFCGGSGNTEAILSTSTSSSTSSGVSSDSSDYHQQNMSSSASWKHDPVSEKIASWLHDHPDFTRNYFVQNANRSWVDSWKSYHNKIPNSPSSRNLLPLDVSVESFGGVAGGGGGLCSERQSSGSGSNTPVRKISSQEFDMVGLRPIVSTNSDGSVTFLSPSIAEVQPSASPGPRRNKRRRSAYQNNLDEHEFLQDLIKDLCDDLDITTLGFKILQNVSLLLEADRCSLFLVEEDRVTRQPMLVSKLFDVTVDSVLDDVIKKCSDNTIRIPLGHGIMGDVAQSGKYANIEDAYKDKRFNVEIDKQTGYITKCLLCMPLKDSTGSVIGVAQAVNKVNSHQFSFNHRDVKVFQSYLSFCGMSIKNAQVYRQSQLETRRNQVLLDLAKVIFEEQSSVKNLIFKIMMHTQSLVQCERVQIFMVGDLSQTEKKEKFFGRVYEYSEDDSIDEESCESSVVNCRFPVNFLLSSSVAKTGEIVNITDAANDSRIEHMTRTRAYSHVHEDDSQVCHDSHDHPPINSVLCMPIKDANGDVVCVFQLTNKRIRSVPGGANGEKCVNCFVSADIYLLEAFGLFCGLGISNTHMYEEMSRAVARQRITLDILSYHAIAPSEDAKRLSKMLIPSARYYKLNQFCFTDFNMSDEETIKGCIRMFVDLDLITQFNIDYTVLCRWLLSVRKNYRPVTYHNWRHAFNVAQTMFTMIHTGRLNQIYSSLEILALIIACLCHDLDHRGTNNQFQVKSMSPFAKLYSTSVLEHHHFDQCVMILSTKGSDILVNLFSDDYHQVIHMIEEAILATDLAIYFQKRNRFIKMIDEQEQDNTLHSFCWDDDDDRALLRCMCMTSCDVAAITKPWESQWKIAQLVASEFFEQGDLEKSELKIKPIEMMDRDKKDELPRMQVEFIDQICLPLYQSIGKLSTHLSPLLSGCVSNRKHWDEEWKKLNSSHKKPSN